MEEKDIEKLLMELAFDRAKWSAVESGNSELLLRIKDSEQKLRTYVFETGCEVSGSGLRVSFAAGRKTYEGKVLHEACEHVALGLAPIEAEIWQHVGVIPEELIVRITNLLSGMRLFAERAVLEGAKQGEKTVRITEPKEKNHE